MNLVSKKYRNNRGKTQKSDFKSLQCHPKQKTLKKRNKLDDNSCFDDNTLKTMRQMWNKRHPDMKIVSRNRPTILKKLRGFLEHSCNNEQCWIDETFTNTGQKRKMKNELFAPNAPKSWKRNINEWLSSVDITNVMKQYEELYPNFMFIGPSPIDFNERMYNSCVWPELCKLNIRKLYNKGITKIGMIFNTDPHYKSGSHWIALFLDMEHKNVLFFDSNGNVIPPELKQLVQNIQKQGMKMGIKIEYDSNEGFKHQMENTECGMYSISFIISILENKHNIKYFKKNRIPDKEVEKLRYEYFNIK